MVTDIERKTNRILVVDDEDTLRSVITQVLEDDGHEVIPAASGEEALELYCQEPFSLVITDIIMGKMSGLELLKEIKGIEPDAVVVVMTSHASLEAATEALRAGAYDFLVKPFEDIDLISAVVNRATDRINLIAQNRTLMEKLQNYARDLEILNEKLKAMAQRDGLTGLYNHRYFSEALEHELARCSRHGHEFSLIFIDIDHFKHYNDTHGHLAGDEALRSLGRILEENKRQTTVAARYGGEEFVLLVPEVSKDGARAFAEKIRTAVEQHAFAGENSQPLGRVTASLGVATFPLDGEDMNTLIHRADKALYQAKHLGRNAVICWTASLN